MDLMNEKGLYRNKNIEKDADEADKIYSFCRFKVKISADSCRAETINIKITNNFNFVTHVRLVSEGNMIREYSCDGELYSCGKGFCSHCRAAMRYLRNDEHMPLLFPDDTAADNSTEKLQPEQEINDSQSMDVSDDIGEKEFFYGMEAEPVPDEPETEIYPEEEPFIPPAENDEADTDADEQTFGQQDIVPGQMHIVFGSNKETGEQIVYRPNDTGYVLNTNIGIIGTMGTGKTQFTQSLVTQICRRMPDNYDGSPISILIFDYKGDYNESSRDFVRATGARIIKPYRMPFNPLSLNLKKHSIALLPMHTANAFKDTISKIYNLGPKQENVLFDCIMDAYKSMGIDPGNASTWKKPAPTFEMVFRQYEKNNAYGDNDKLAVVMKKLRGFEIFDPDPFRTVSLAELLRGVVVIDISDYDEDIRNLVVAITLDQFYAQMQNPGPSKTDGVLRQLRSFILVDEADNFMKMNFPSLRKIMKEGREFGVGTILSTQSLSHFSGSDDDYSKYIITWIIHNVNDMNRRSIETILNQSRTSPELESLFQTIKGLKKHESVVKISNSDPMVMHDKPFWELMNEPDQPAVKA